MRDSELIQQVGHDPATAGADARQCVGGPCNGQRMRVADGHVLIIARDFEGGGTRAVSLPPHAIQLGKDLGTYAGHYADHGDGVLRWHGDVQ